MKKYVKFVLKVLSALVTSIYSCKCCHNCKGVKYKATYFRLKRSEVETNLISYMPALHYFTTITTN